MEKNNQEISSIPKKILETDKLQINYEEETGHKIVNEFIFLETLGRGACSKVKKCINKNLFISHAICLICQLSALPSSFWWQH